MSDLRGKRSIQVLIENEMRADSARRYLLVGKKRGCRNQREGGGL
jgi:hypothetical protein